MSAERNEDSGHGNDPNNRGDLQIADDKGGSSQPLSAFSGPFDLAARHMTQDDSQRKEHKYQDQSRDRHCVGSRR
jgi:hypothetical protein